MRVALMPPIAVGDAIEPDRVLYAEVARGCGLREVVEVSVLGGGHAQVSGAELRAALLSASHPGPWKLGFVGAGRYGLQLDPDGRCSTIAHLDARGLANPSYWLYRRGDDGPVRLTRWTRAGTITKSELLEQAGGDPASLSTTAAKEAFTALVAGGLPASLEVAGSTAAAPERVVEAPRPGWLDVPPGRLKGDAERVPVHEVDDLGTWPEIERGP